MGQPGKPQGKRAGLKTITVSLEALVSKYNDHLGHVLSCITDAQKHTDEFVVIGTSLWENINPREYWPKVLEIKQHLDHIGVGFLVLLNSSTDQYKFDNGGIDCEYVDFFLLRTWHYHLENPAASRTKGSRILFLPGKPDKHHRAPLLAKFWENRTLDRLRYSFYVDAGLESSTRRLFPQYDDARWQEFLKLQQTLDPINIVRLNGMHFSAFPFDTDLYQQTGCSIVSETCFDPRPIWITEKTWRAMIYQHPFVIAAIPGTLSRLESKGFKTFLEYLPHPDYDSVVDMSERLEKIYENSLALQENLSENIDLDIEHNYNNCKRLYENNLQRVGTRLERFNIKKDPLQVIPLHDPLMDPAKTRIYEEAS